MTITASNPDISQLVETERHLLVADIGGTNARFAVVDTDKMELSHAETVATQDYRGILDAASQYLSRLSGPPPARSCIAVACPAREDQVSLTNNHWSFSVEGLCRSLKLRQLIVVNDFKALAAGVLLLKADEYVQIGSGEPQAQRPITVIGAGTGLGVATITREGNRSTIIDGEGGHVGFAPRDHREVRILEILARQFDRVSMERLLSGDGIVNLYRALSEINGYVPESHTAADIVGQTRAGACSVCSATVKLFSSLLGGFAGDAALSMGSEGGIYIGGGIVPRMGDVFDREGFRKGFEAKGRMSYLLRSIPSFLITSDQAALWGAACLVMTEVDQQTAGDHCIGRSGSGA